MQLSLRSYPEREDTHVHSFHQAALPLDGRMDIKVGDVAGSIMEGQGVIIASGTQHVFHVSGANHFVVLDIPCRRTASIESRHPFFEYDDTLGELLHYAARELRSGGLGAEGEFHLAALVAGKIRRGFTAPAQSCESVARALAVMRERYSERLSIAEVAGASGLAVNRFHELFRRETGRTPGEMLAEIRLDRAEDLLGQTSLPIAEIALMVGFSEQSALTRCFRRRRGTTPDAWRRCIRQSS